MPAKILSGPAIRDQIYTELRAQIEALRAQGIRPGLATVLVGDDPASHVYVNSKVEATAKLGLASFPFTRPATATTAELLKLVAELNANNEVDGILVQLPLPPQVDSKLVLESVDPAKDVDGFHPTNLGKLVTGRSSLVACTPSGVMEILRRSGIQIEGANAVVVGRSDIVGKPMALLLMNANATVTICHSRTREIGDIIRRADIVVAAIGKPGFVKAEWIRPGAAVIDVGINRLTDEALAASLFANFPDRLARFRERGSTIVGDVHPDAANVAGAFTPVPGGVGPLTIAMLMRNTVRAAKMRRGSSTSTPASQPASQRAGH